MNTWGVKVCSVQPSGFKTQIFGNIGRDVTDGWAKAPKDIKNLYGKDYDKAGMHM